MILITTLVLDSKHGCSAIIKTILFSLLKQGDAAYGARFLLLPELWNKCYLTRKKAPIVKEDLRWDKQVASKMVPRAHYFFCHRPPTYSMVTIYWPREAFRIDKWTPLPLLKVYTSAVLLLTYPNDFILHANRFSYFMCAVKGIYVRITMSWNKTKHNSIFFFKKEVSFMCLVPQRYFTSGTPPIRLSWFWKMTNKSWQFHLRQDVVWFVVNL